MTLEAWFAFVAVWTLLSLPLGPNALATMAASMASGLTGGVAVATGIATAGVIHMLIACFGLGALVLASAEAFQVLKWLGVFYLLWLGLSAWRSSGESLGTDQDTPQPAATLFRRGVVVSLTNPKAILSYTAGFTQFISATEPLAPQLAVLIPTSTAIVFAVYVGYATLALPLRRWLTTPARQRVINRTFGGGFIAAAMSLTLVERR